MIDLILSEIKNGLVILLQVNKLKNSRLICLKFNLKWLDRGFIPKTEINQNLGQLWASELKWEIKL